MDTGIGLEVCVMGKVLANPFRELCASVFHLCHCSCPQEQVSSFCETSEPHYVCTCVHMPSPWPTLWKAHLGGQSCSSDSSSNSDDQPSCQSMILQIIPLMADFLSVLLNFNIHVEMYTHKRLTQQISYKLNILRWPTPRFRNRGLQPPPRTPAPLSAATQPWLPTASIPYTWFCAFHYAVVLK